MMRQKVALSSVDHAASMHDGVMYAQRWMGVAKCAKCQTFIIATAFAAKAPVKANQRGQAPARSA